MATENYLLLLFIVLWLTSAVMMIVYYFLYSRFATKIKRYVKKYHKDAIESDDRFFSVNTLFSWQGAWSADIAIIRAVKDYDDEVKFLKTRVLHYNKIFLRWTVATGIFLFIVYSLY